MFASESTYVASKPVVKELPPELLPWGTPATTAGRGRKPKKDKAPPPPQVRGPSGDHYPHIRMVRAPGNNRGPARGPSGPEWGFYHLRSHE
eukprot:2052814-Pyramimonas_sp.AAC.1